MDTQKSVVSFSSEAAEIERLSWINRRWAVHDEDCSTVLYSDAWSEYVADCTCGLDEATKGESFPTINFVHAAVRWIIEESSVPKKELLTRLNASNLWDVSKAVIRDELK